MNVFFKWFPARYRARMRAYMSDMGRCDTQSRCALQASSLLAIIHSDLRACVAKFDSSIDDDIAAPTARRCGVSAAAFDRILTLLNGDDGLLFDCKSNQLALATIAEALRQAQIHTVESEQSMMQRSIVVLEAIEAAIEADYPVTVQPSSATKMRLALLTHLGKGIAHLTESRAARERE
jgi:hypothetical protein